MRKSLILLVCLMFVGFATNLQADTIDASNATVNFSSGTDVLSVSGFVINGTTYNITFGTFTDYTNYTDVSSGGDLFMSDVSGATTVATDLALLFNTAGATSIDPFNTFTPEAYIITGGDQDEELAKGSLTGWGPLTCCSNPYEAPSTVISGSAHDATYAIFTAAVPEPSSIVLILMGLGFVSVAVIQKKKLLQGR